MRTFKKFKTFLLVEDSDSDFLAALWDRLEDIARKGITEKEDRKAYEYAVDIFNTILDDWGLLKRTGKLMHFFQQADNYLKSVEYSQRNPGARGLAKRNPQ